MRRKLLLKSLIIILLIFPVIAWSDDNKDKKSTDVRVQDNGWLRIVDHFAESKIMWELRKEEDWKKYPRTKNMHLTSRELYVKVQFLKPCKAKTLGDLMEEASLKAESDKYSTILVYVWAYVEFMKDGREKEANEYRTKMLKRYPDLDEILDKYYLHPQYKCGDYRTTVFVTFYDSLGSEIKTAKKLPFVYRDEWEEGKRKTEKLPGETTHVTFFIPEGATSWDVWLPK